MNKKIQSGLSPDLWRRVPSLGGIGGGGSERGAPGPIERDKPATTFGEAIYIGRGFQSRSVTVLTTPTLIISADVARPYLLKNPSQSIGLASYGLIRSGTLIANGNSQATPLGVANYLNMHFFLNVTALTGAGTSWTFIQQAYDPQSLQWADVQNIFTGVAATGTYYALVGTLGVATDLAVRWTMDVAGTIAMTLSYVLKYGLGGSAIGLSQTVYLSGNSGVNRTSAYDLLEGQERAIIMGEGAELWGISDTPTVIKVFQLQP